MSEINANFIVDQSAVNIQSDNNIITVDAEPISLNVFSLGFTSAGGQPGNLQFNDAGSLGGAANTVVSAGNVSFTNISNLKIANGSNGYFLQTDGTGNLTWAPGTANITGNGTAAGANTQIQVTDGAGNFVAAPGFTFDNSTNVFTTPGNAVINGNLTATANITANYFIGNGSQLTGISGNVNVINANATSNTTYYPVFVSGIGNVEPQIDNFGNVLAFIPNSGTLNTNILDIATIKNSNGNVNISNNVVVNANASANYFIGNGSALTDITGANVTGTVANANYAAYSGNANVANSATTAGTVTTNAQPNITSVGTLSNLDVTGNITAGNVYANSGTIGANLVTGTLTTAAQPNITSLGTLTGLSVNGTVTANYFSGEGSNITNVRSIANGVSSITIPTANGNIQVNPGGITNLVTFSNVGMRLFTNEIALGASTATGTRTVAIGLNALATNPSFDSIGIGANAGRQNQGNGAIAIGRFAGETNASAYTVAVGYGAGQGGLGTGQGANAVAIGYNAGYNNQGTNAIAVGSEAASLNQANNSIAIGKLAGYSNLTSNSIVIGHKAGYGANAIPNNTIYLNATGANMDGSSTFDPPSANAFYVKPLRFNGYYYVLGYNDQSGEISYYNTASTFDIQISNITDANISNLSLQKFQQKVVNGGNTGAATLTPNASAGSIYKYNLTGNITLNTLANAVAGTSMTIILTQDSIGNRLLTSTMKFAGNIRTLSTTANSIDVMSVFYDGSTYYADLTKGYV